MAVSTLRGSLPFGEGVSARWLTRQDSPGEYRLDPYNQRSTFAGPWTASPEGPKFEVIIAGDASTDATEDHRRVRRPLSAAQRDPPAANIGSRQFQGYNVAKYLALCEKATITGPIHEAVKAGKSTWTRHPETTVCFHPVR